MWPIIFLGHDLGGSLIKQVRGPAAVDRSAASRRRVLRVKPGAPPRRGRLVLPMDCPEHNRAGTYVPLVMDRMEAGDQAISDRSDDVSLGVFGGRAGCAVRIADRLAGSTFLAVRIESQTRSRGSTWSCACCPRPGWRLPAYFDFFWSYPLCWTIRPVDFLRSRETTRLSISTSAAAAREPRNRWVFGFQCDPHGAV